MFNLLYFQCFLRNLPSRGRPGYILQLAQRGEVAANRSCRPGDVSPPEKLCCGEAGGPGGLRSLLKYFAGLGSQGFEIEWLVEDGQSLACDFPGGIRSKSIAGYYDGFVQHVRLGAFDFVQHIPATHASHAHIQQQQVEVSPSKQLQPSLA